MLVIYVSFRKIQQKVIIFKLHKFLKCVVFYFAESTDSLTCHPKITDSDAFRIDFTSFYRMILSVCILCNDLKNIIVVRTWICQSEIELHLYGLFNVQSNTHI